MKLKKKEKGGEKVLRNKKKIKEEKRNRMIENVKGRRNHKWSESKKKENESKKNRKREI